jgi:hypothetical protein
MGEEHLTVAGAGGVGPLGVGLGKEGEELGVIVAGGLVEAVGLAVGEPPHATSASNAAAIAIRLM